MKKEEKIQAVKDKITGWINGMNGQYDHIEFNGEIVVKVGNYFPITKEPYGSFIYKMYKDKLEIATPLSPRYSMLDTTVVINSISYDQLTEEDADAAYNNLFHG